MWKNLSKAKVAAAEKFQNSNAKDCLLRTYQRGVKFAVYYNHLEKYLICTQLVTTGTSGRLVATGEELPSM